MSANDWQREPPPEYSTLQERANWPPFLERLKREVWPMYVTGPVGTGKSCLAALAFCKFKGRVAKWYRWCDFVADAITLENKGEICRWQGGQDGQFVEITQASFWSIIAQCGLLVIDEIGTGNQSEKKSELLWKLLEVRKKSPMIITGNMDGPAVAAFYDARVASRLFAGQFVLTKGADERRQGFENRIK